MKKSNVYGILATITTMLAMSVATSACVFFLYQPEEPKSISME